MVVILISKHKRKPEAKASGFSFAWLPLRALLPENMFGMCARHSLTSFLTFSVTRFTKKTTWAFLLAYSCTGEAMCGRTCGERGCVLDRRGRRSLQRADGCSVETFSSGRRQYADRCAVGKGCARGLYTRFAFFCQIPMRQHRDLIGAKVHF